MVYVPFIRRAMLVTLAFNALSQFGGAVGLLTGAISPPLTLLSDTPFTSYTVPALILGVVTGGSSLVALRLVWLSARLVGDFASIIAGCITVGWILGEVILFKESVAGFLNVPLQVIYFVTGLVVLGLAGWLWLTDWERAHRQESRHHHGVA